MLLIQERFVDILHSWIDGLFRTTKDYGVDEEV